MPAIDKIAYIVRERLPLFYNLAALAGSYLTLLMNRREISHAIDISKVEGTVQGKPATMRALTSSDLQAATDLIAGIPEAHLRYFRPHGLDKASLAKVIGKKDIMTYGLFIDNKMCGYAILKLFPTKKTYIGRIVTPSLTDLGIGKFFSRYLYWQARVLGFRPCSTIHRDNIASLQSHAAVRPYQIISNLPNDYLLIEFEILPEDASKPELNLG